jgi:transcriptional regulator with XRE-family HTH domain
MLINLGKELKRAREQKGASLQTIADSSNISTAYLQKLERGQVLSPSPHVLRRLSSAVGLSYLFIMELAEYLDEEEALETRLVKKSPRPHPLADKQLSTEEWHRVGAFIKTIIAERQI